VTAVEPVEARSTALGAVADGDHLLGR
jgi:hypothetical protein